MLSIGGFIMSLRLWAVPFTFVLYILYQRVGKGRPFASLKNDIGVSAFFIAIYLGLYLLLFRTD